MQNLQEATERICELKGNLIAIDVLLPVLLKTLPPSACDALARSFEAHAEVARTVILNSTLSEHVLAAFEREIVRTQAVLARIAPQPELRDAPLGADSVLMAMTRVNTLAGQQRLSGASGFFFRREHRLFLVTNRHAFADEPSGHFPDRIEIGVHTDRRDLTKHAVLALPLYRHGRQLWMQAPANAGIVDVAVIEIEAGRLPEPSVLQAFDPTHLDLQGVEVALGDALTVIGFPSGFHDTIHHLAIAREASVASAYGVPFRQQGYFLTDARTHRGSSGAPVLRRQSARPTDGAALPWQLLGIHSNRMDAGTAERAEDASLGLNRAWYAGVLMALTNE